MKTNNNLTNIANKICWCAGLLLTLYELIVGWIGTPLSLQHRPLCAGVILFILFLIKRYSR